MSLNLFLCGVLASSVGVTAFGRGRSRDIAVPSGAAGELSKPEERECVMERYDIVQEMVYESPELVEVGGFAEVTLGGGSMWADYLTAMDY